MIKNKELKKELIKKFIDECTDMEFNIIFKQCVDLDCGIHNIVDFGITNEPTVNYKDMDKYFMTMCRNSKASF